MNEQDLKYLRHLSLPGTAKNATCPGLRCVRLEVFDVCGWAFASWVRRVWGGSLGVMTAGFLWWGGLGQIATNCVMVGFCGLVAGALSAGCLVAVGWCGARQVMGQWLMLWGVLQ